MLRFPLIVGVVFIHAYTYDIDSAGSSYHGSIMEIGNFLAQNLFSQVYARGAVPLFFLMSGYLLFYDKEITWSLVRNKWKSRSISLLIPYIFWNAAVLAIQFVGQQLPVMRGFFSRSRWDINTMTWGTITDAFVGYEVGPVNYPLWFLRDLILLVALAPLIALIIRTKHLGHMFLFFVFFCWLGLFQLSDMFISYEAILFFSLGIYLGSHRYAVPELGRWKILVMVLIYNLAAFVEVYCMWLGLDMVALHKFNVIAGVSSFVALAACVPGRGTLAAVLIRLSASSFFIYVAHGLLLRVMYKLPFAVFDCSGAGALLIIYFFATISTIALLVSFYYLVLPFLPRWIQLVMLGRYLKPSIKGVSERTC